jgi:MFS transporter, PAT family, beta-lactamase induction signal transducer AmpG
VKPHWARTTWGRRGLFAALYFAEGAPIGLIWWALPTWLREAGQSPGSIALLTGLVTWPWALKALWAPMVDLVRGPRFGLRGWLMLSQLGMVLSLIPLLVYGLDWSAQALIVILLIHAVCAATQDAVIDTVAILGVPAEQRGSLSGFMQAGMLGARALFGGGALWMASQWGERTVIALLIVAIAVPGALASLAFQELTSRVAAQRRPLAEYLQAAGQMFRRRELWAGFVFACTAGAGFEGLTGLGGPFLLDRGATIDEVGELFFLPVVIAMAAGAVLGGLASDRFGRRLWTFIGELGAAIMVLILALSAWLTTPETLAVGWFASGLIVLYGLIGLATASLYGLLMELTDARLAAFQFCVFMSGINLCYVGSQHFLNRVVDQWGYGPSFVVLACVSLLALLCLPWLKPQPGDAPIEQAV